MNYLEVITGPMFSGKTTKLIEKVKEYKGVNIYKPKIDTRYHNNFLVTHDGQRNIAQAVNSICDIELKNDEDYFFDEVQFYGNEFIDKLNSLRNCKIFCSGLNLDYLGRPFGIMPKLIKMAHKVHYLVAECEVCHKPAERTFRKCDSRDQVYIGERESYSARCIDHFNNGYNVSYGANL